MQKIQQFAIRSPYESLSEVAIRFSLEPAGVSTVIVGAARIKDVRQNIEVLNLPPLGQDIVQKLKNDYGDKTAEANAY